MRLYILVGLLAAAGATPAFATEDANCPVDSEHHTAAQTHAAAPNDTQRSHKETWMMPAAVAETPVAAPATTIAPVTAPVRQHARKHPRSMEAGIPDSVLMDGSGAL